MTHDNTTAGETLFFLVTDTGFTPRRREYWVLRGYYKKYISPKQKRQKKEANTHTHTNILYIKVWPIRRGE